jgi:hypothetical protein
MGRFNCIYYLEYKFRTCNTKCPGKILLWKRQFCFLLGPKWSVNCPVLFTGNSRLPNFSWGVHHTWILWMFIEIKICRSKNLLIPSTQPWYQMSVRPLPLEGVSDCCFNATSAIFQLYHGENKLIFNEMMMMSTLY